MPAQKNGYFADCKKMFFIRTKNKGKETLKFLSLKIHLLTYILEEKITENTHLIKRNNKIRNLPQLWSTVPIWRTPPKMRPLQCKNIDVRKKSKNKMENTNFLS